MFPILEGHTEIFPTKNLETFLKYLKEKLKGLEGFQGSKVLVYLTIK